MQRVRSMSIAIRAMLVCPPHIHPRVFPVLPRRIYRGKVVSLVGWLDSLICVDAVVLASGQIPIPPGMVYAQDARLDGLGHQRPEHIGAVIVEDLDLVSV